MAEINLVPEYVVKSREKVVYEGLLKKISIVLMIVSTLIFLVTLYMEQESSGNLDTLRKDLSKVESAVMNLYPTQEKSVGLANRLSDIGLILGDRNYYSVFFESLNPLIPAGVFVGDINVQDPQIINISGDTASYSALSLFLSNVSLEAKSENTIFKDITLAEVAFKKATGRYSFVVEITLAPDSLKKFVKDKSL